MYNIPSRRLFKDSKLTLHTFGVWLLAALRLNGREVLDDRDERRLHEAFKEAFDVIREGLGDDQLRFVIILDRYYGISPDVNAIMWHSWLGIWATRDAPGTIWRLHNMSRNVAWSYVHEEALGGPDLWIKAAEAFEHYLATHHS